MTKTNSVLKVLGAPGTGKTTFAIGKVREALLAGVMPDEVMYVSFTRKAIQEALERIREHGTPADFPWFRTLHSFVFLALALTKGQVLTEHDIENFLPEHAGAITARLKAAQQRRALTGETVDEVADALETDTHPINRLYLERYEEDLRAYKKASQKMDFNDMLLEFIKRPMVPPLKLLVVDEAQDLSLLQWRVVDLLIESAEHTILAGDPAQAVYEWAGAGPRLFEQREGEVYVLPQSHRVPIKIQKLADTVRRRYSGDFYGYAPTQTEGEIHHLPAGAYHNIPFDNGETWLVLARTWRALEDVRSYLWQSKTPWKSTGRYVASQGLEKYLRWIGWYEKMRKTGELSIARQTVLQNEIHDLEECVINQVPWWKAFVGLPDDAVEFLKACISTEPKVILSSVHAAKGGEADNVVIEGRLTAHTQRLMETEPEREAPVLYVALTRTRNRLYLMESARSTGYAWGALIGDPDEIQATAPPAVRAG